MTPAQYNGLLAAIQGATVATAGTIIMYGGASTPSGYLPCNGAAVSRTGYSALFAALGTAWGAGDASTTFNVPDLRGRSPIGVGTGSGLTARALATQYGAEGVVVDQAYLKQPMAFPVTDPGHDHNVQVTTDTPVVGGTAGIWGNSTAISVSTIMGAAAPDTTGITVDSGGSNTPLPVVHPTAGVNYFIKT